jgi:hypothetical protein
LKVELQVPVRDAAVVLLPGDAALSSPITARLWVNLAKVFLRTWSRAPAAVAARWRPLVQWSRLRSRLRLAVADAELRVAVVVAVAPLLLRRQPPILLN